MKMNLLIALCAVLSAGVYESSAQPFPPSVPLTIGVTNIRAAGVTVFVPSSPQVNGAAFLSFHFVRDDDIKLDELIRDGVRSKRLVRIVERERIVAEGRLAGQAHGIEADRLVLAFDLPRLAREAAIEISKLAVVIIPKWVLDDRRNWIL